LTLFKESEQGAHFNWCRACAVGALNWSVWKLNARFVSHLW